MAKVKWSDRDVIADLVAESFTKSEVLTKLKLTCTMGNYMTLEKWCKKHLISIEHFTPNKMRIAKLIKHNTLWTIETACVERSLCYRGIVKRLILRDGAIEHQCRDCGIEAVWNGKPITLQLEHMNGVNDDHRLSNLCFLCPNCHSQTDTYAGRNGAKALPIIKAVPTVSDVELRLKDLLSKVPDELFRGWGAKKAVAAAINVHQGKLMFYIKRYAPEFEYKFTK